MLSDRRQQVLRALIEEYIAHAMPVGSRTIVEHYGLGVSSATVRNDLSALEDEGYIQQPHTSAGRIPTDAGYRAYVEELIASGALKDDHPHRSLVEQLRKSADVLDELMERTSAELARLTDCLSLVLPPDEGETHLRQISRMGLSALMRKPEFQDSSTLLPLMEILEDESVLLSVFNDEGQRSGNIMVRIGSENASAGLSGVSVITGVYGRGSAQGIVAVIGPTRMDYTGVIRAVRAARDAMGENG
ncbi:MULTISPECIES: heat-inducible transcriptional repressor HrcA [unclassified Adlercreutzia]|uniref:HrcA family transcriptional regulator n=1 Tax=unclassified Adlercreutzia TaxID=2636013 RepID=UPI0013EBC817|nr:MULTISPECIES: DeoR family transcriptional regulator [unclassified Adlercreutzia]